MLPAPVIALSLSTLADLAVVGAAGLVGAAAATVGVLAFRDRLQTRDALTHNRPLISRLIPWIDREGGPLARNRVIAPDNNQKPFNRIQRDWAKQLASGKPLAITAHGAKDDLQRPNNLIFVNAQYGVLEKDQKPVTPLTIGPYARVPYTPKSIFNISAMSHGSLGKNAVLTLSKGAKLADCWLDTGEGGLAPYHLEGHCDLIFQIGTAKYGVCKPDKPGLLDDDELRDIASHEEVKMIEIKLNQGAKPGKGGVLPGSKVTAEIAKIRDIKEGEDSISPNGHLEIRNDSDLLDFIKRVRDVSGRPTGIKTAFSSRAHIESLCQEIVKRGPESAPDFITLDGGEGGSGASPTILMNNCGLSVRDSLPMLTETLVKYNLKDRIRTIVSGQLGTSDAASWALCAGADFVNAARGVKQAMGCVMSHECHEGTCVAGITTHDPELQKALDPEVKSVSVANYIRGVRNEIEVLAHSCGLAEPREFRPHHVNIVQPDGHPRLLSEIYPNLRFGSPPAVLKK